MTVLIDTSIWIRHLQLAFAPLAALEAREVLRHELVYGELVIGDTGGRRAFLEHYQRYAAAPLVPHGEVVIFVRAQRLAGLGLSWIDAHLLASARVAGARLWTADQTLARVAHALGLGGRAA